MRRAWKIGLGALGAVLLAAVGAVMVVAPNFFELLGTGEEKTLRDASGTPAGDDRAVLVLALDGIDRAQLYEMLGAGELPNLARLLGGGAGSAFPHAYLDPTATAALPTSTLASWATIFTGRPAGEHGVAGNEYFVRKARRFEAPGPVSVFEPDLVLKTYTDGYANGLLQVPTIYERLRARRADLSMWVSMAQFHRGADRLLLANRTVLADAFAAFLDDDDDDDDLELFADLDREVVENLVEALDAGGAPHVLTLYLSGADAFAHGSRQGADASRRTYLIEIMEPLMKSLTDALERNRARHDRYVLVVSDHGHTEVIHDEAHALGTGDDAGDPPAVVARAGYRLRPFEYEVDDADDFDTVLAYGGALAYVYVADRSTCPAPGTRCDWTRPPRPAEDVRPLAAAFAAMPWIDLVLVRGTSGMFEVKDGARTVPIDAYLAAHPRAGYVAVEERVRELTTGPFGDHAGDILLIAKNGAEPDVAGRYYFSSLYHSWHGSPGRKDSEIPLILAHPTRDAAALKRLVRRVAGATTETRDVAAIVEAVLFEP